MNYYYDAFGRKRRFTDLQTVEHLFKLKAKSGSNPWPVVEECLRIWSSTNPKQYNSFLYEIDEIRNTRKDKKFALSKEKAFRYTLDFPEIPLKMIRCIYSVEELPMDKGFFNEVARKFPTMKVAEKN